MLHWSHLGEWVPKISTLDDIFRCNVYYLRRLASDLETQFKGIVAIVDLKNLEVHHVRHVTPSYAKKVAALIQVPQKSKSQRILKDPQRVRDSFEGLLLLH